MTLLFQAYHESGNMQVIEVNCFEAYSPKGHYLYLTTSTEDPSVDTYMIFTVRTNVFVEEINYLVSFFLGSLLHFVHGQHIAASHFIKIPFLSNFFMYKTDYGSRYNYRWVNPDDGRYTEDV